MFEALPLLAGYSSIHRTKVQFALWLLPTYSGVLSLGGTSLPLPCVLRSLSISACILSLYGFSLRQQPLYWCISTVSKYLSSYVKGSRNIVALINKKIQNVSIITYCIVNNPTYMITYRSTYVLHSDKCTNFSEYPMTAMGENWRIPCQKL